VNLPEEGDHEGNLFQVVYTLNRQQNLQGLFIRGNRKFQVHLRYVRLGKDRFCRCRPSPNNFEMLGPWSERSWRSSQGFESWPKPTFVL